MIVLDLDLTETPILSDSKLDNKELLAKSRLIRGTPCV